MPLRTDHLLASLPARLAYPLLLDLCPDITPGKSSRVSSKSEMGKAAIRAISSAFPLSIKWHYCSDDRHSLLSAFYYRYCTEYCPYRRGEVCLWF